MRKKVIITLALTLVILISTEIFLRTYFGFCDTVIMREDPDYEYTAIPNQKRFRFRNNILYNAESMRSGEIDNNAVKIIGFGDSVINGGVLTDQDALATTILSDTLSKLYNKKIQFLNISAGSWGPDNCYAFLKKHGDYQAKHIFLFVSSHDAYDNMNFEKIVGVAENFPNKQYKLALYELLDRYIFPRLGLEFHPSATKSDKLGINKEQEGSTFNTGFESFANYSKDHKIPLTIYLHAELSELMEGEYNEQGQKIIQFAKENDIQIIKDLEDGLQATDFRDDIHLNEPGQRRLSLITLKHGI